MSAVKALCTFFLMVSIISATAQDGSPDPQFGNNGIRVITLENRNTRGDVMLHLKDGSIILGVNSDTTKWGGWFDVCFYIYKLNPNGDVDTSFGQNGTLYFPQGSNGVSLIYSAAQQADGDIVMSCVTDGGLNTLRFDPSGQNDTLIAVPGISNYTNKRYIAVQSDQKLLTMGSYPSGTSTKMSAYKHKPKGTPDLTFGTNGLLNFNPTSYKHVICGHIALQSDDKIISVGSAYDSEAHRNAIIMRFNTDGSLDSTFGNMGITYPPLGAQQYAGHFYDLEILPNGKIIAVGIIEYPGGTGGWYANHPLVVRFNADGSVDSTFGGDGTTILYTIYNANDIIESVVVQPDGKIILGGRSSFPFPVMQSDFYVTRLNADGSMDASFGTNGYFLTNFQGAETSVVRALSLQPDNKILAYGLTKDSTNNYFRAVICRLQNDSTLSLEAPALGNIAVYPNPAGNELNIEGFGVESFEIYKTDGRLVHSGSCNPLARSAHTIDLDPLKSGVYFLVLYSARERDTRIFIKKE